MSAVSPWCSYRDTDAYQSSSLLQLDAIQVLRPELLVMAILNGHHGEIAANVILHGVYPTLLDAGDGQESAGPQKLEFARRVARLQQVSGQRLFGGGVESLSGNCQQLCHLILIPLGRDDGAVSYSGRSESAGGHNGAEEAGRVGVLEIREPLHSILPIEKWKSRTPMR